MAKKSRRTRRKATRQQSTQVARPAGPKAASTPADGSASGKVDLEQEYAYVFTDLRRIGSIAAIMFALLFVLAFVLR